MNTAVVCDRHEHSRRFSAAVFLPADESPCVQILHTGPYDDGPAAVHQSKTPYKRYANRAGCTEFFHINLPLLRSIPDDPGGQVREGFEASPKFFVPVLRLDGERRRFAFRVPDLEQLHSCKTVCRQ